MMSRVMTWLNWDARPSTETSADAGELLEHLRPRVAKWWLPDEFAFIDEIPKTSVGKFRKIALREQFAQEPAARA